MRTIYVLLCLLLTITASKAQLATFDAGVNKKLATQNKNHTMTLMYEKIKAEVASGSLIQANILSNQVQKELALVNEVYALASGMQNLKKIKNFYNRAALINQTIRLMTQFLVSTPASKLPEDVKRTITKGLKNSTSDMALAMETMQYGMNTVNKLSIRERLTEIDDASSKLDHASSNLTQGHQIIKIAIQSQERTDKMNEYYNLKYNINN